MESKTNNKMPNENIQNLNDPKTQKRNWKIDKGNYWMIIELIPKSNKVGEGSINHHLSILNKHFLSLSLSKDYQWEKIMINWILRMEFLTKENKERDEIWVHENELCYDKITLTRTLSLSLAFCLSLSSRKWNINGNSLGYFHPRCYVMSYHCCFITILLCYIFSFILFIYCFWEKHILVSFFI